MSLDVSPDLLARAEAGPVDDDAFLACVEQSLPYARGVVRHVAAGLATDGGEMYDHEVPPPSEADRGQLLRALASDPIRAALERRFGVRLAFQNCHRVAAFAPQAVGGPRWSAFVSARGQLLNQSPELRNC